MTAFAMFSMPEGMVVPALVLALAAAGAVFATIRSRTRGEVSTQGTTLGLPRPKAGEGTDKNKK